MLLLLCSLPVRSDKGRAFIAGRQQEQATGCCLCREHRLEFTHPCVFRAPRKDSHSSSCTNQSPRGWGYPALPAQIVRPAKAAGRPSQGLLYPKALALEGEDGKFSPLLQWIFFKLALLEKFLKFCFFIYLCAGSSLLLVLSLVVVSGGYFALWWLGFSLQGLLVLGSTGSTVEAPKLSCSVACWNLPGLGIKAVSPALADGFFTTEPPGMPCNGFLQHSSCLEHFKK